MKPELEAARFFLAENDIFHIGPFGEGNVNDTYLVTLASGERLVLQRVNPAVFPDPALVIRNVRLVTEHLLRSIAGRRGREIPFQPVILHAGKSGYAFRDRDGSAWRMMDLVKGTRTCQTITSTGQAKELGRTLGLFHALAHTLDPEALADTLPGFHYTPGYLDHYDRVCSGPREDGPAHNPFCRHFIEKRRNRVNLLEERRDELSHGVIHGDPKTANFLFDDAGEKVISLIDLDTVRPGLLLHDIGDALRSCCNRAGEAPAAPEDACFDPRLYTAWLQGYFSATGSLLTGEDGNRAVDAVSLIAFELGLRFYTDYLERNRYFKVSRPEQNLRRAMTQFYLAESIERQADLLEAVVNDLTAAGKR